MIGLGIGIPLTRTTSGPTLGTTIATTHYNRVIADGGVLPAGISGLGSVLDSVISAYSITGSSDFNTKVPVFLDPHYTGYKLGAGSGTTLGQAARTVYAINSSADVTQTTAASQPLLLAHSGTNYWWSSGVAGNYCSTPNASANQITGDIEFIAYVNFQDSGNQDTIFIKSDAVAGTSYCYSFWKNGNNLSLTYSNGGTVAARVTSTSSATLSSVGYTYGTDIWVKGNRSATTGDVKFYYGSNGTTWTQLGTTQSTTAQTIYNASIPLWVGDWANILFQFKGKIYRATISDTIGGTPVVDFNPATYNAATSQTQWTSTTGEVWTINTGTAATGYKGVLVNRTIMQSDGIASALNNTLSGSGRFTQYLAVSPLGSIASNEAIAGPWNALNWRGAIYTNNSKFATYQGSGADGVYGSTITKARLIQTGVVNSSTGTDWIPFVNGVDVSNGGLNIGTQNAFTSINIFARSGGITFSNSIVSTYIMSAAADNSTQRTAMYNVIKPMNNNAF